jgi:hypothetical protein
MLLAVTNHSRNQDIHGKHQRQICQAGSYDLGCITQRGERGQNRIDLGALELLPQESDVLEANHDSDGSSDQRQDYWGKQEYYCDRECGQQKKLLANAQEPANDRVMPILFTPMLRRFFRW